MTGAVLQQQDINGDWHPCGYILHSFDATQCNYKIYDRELLGIICALETWHHYLQGSPFPTVILSDHKNLTYFWTAQKLNRWQAWWSLFLSEFDLKLLHTPGFRMIQSNVLSCWPDYIMNGTNNDNVIVLPNNIFIKAIDFSLQETIQELIKDDNLFAKALESIKHHGPVPIKSKFNEWSMNDGLLFFWGWCYIPSNDTLRQQITQFYHDILSSGHPGHLKTLELVQCHYWWPGITVFIKNYLADCAICQQVKVNTYSSTPGLILIKAQPNATLFSQVTCDFITDLPENNGFDSIMVMVNYGSTKGVISIPCNKTIDAAQTAQNYIDHVYQRFELSDSFLSNRGPQFSL